MMRLEEEISVMFSCGCSFYVWRSLICWQRRRVTCWVPSATTADNQRQYELHQLFQCDEHKISALKENGIRILQNILSDFN